MGVAGATGAPVAFGCDRPSAHARWWEGGLRGEGPLAAVVAGTAALYGTGAFVLWAIGQLVGDATGWLYMSNLSVFYWLAPALGLAACAVAARWWGVAVVCGLCASVWLALFGPAFVPHHVAVAPTLRVATYNISPTPQIDHVRRFVADADPDVLLVQELVPEAQDALIAALTTLPHHHFAQINDTAPGGGGTAVFSRYRLADADAVSGLPAASRPADVVTVRTPDGPLSVLSLHLTSPCEQCLTSDLSAVSENAESLRTLGVESQMRRLEVARVVAQLPSGPLIVGGDLNSSTANAPRRGLLAAGLVDLHRAVGVGPGVTAVRKDFGFKIDWLFGSADLTPVREWTGADDVSDHRPVVADVAMPAQGPRRPAA